MNHCMKSPLRARLLTGLFLLCLGAGALAAEVVSVISSSTTRVGEPVILLYRFVNSPQPANMPQPSINVPGLDIRFNGVTSQSSQSFTFGGRGAQRDVSSVYEFMYVVTPNQPGNFTIPGFAVSVGGRQMRTKPVALTVTGPGGYVPPAQPPPVRQVIPPPFPPQTAPQQQARPPRAPQQPQQPSARGGRTPPRLPSGEPAPYFGEIIAGSRSAYVGEVVPVELRFYFRADIAFNDLQRPSFGGDGFTAAPLTEPEQTEQFLDNVPYNLVTFRSAITPVKVGEIEIPPATMEGRMMASGAPTGLDPFFDQFFQNFPVPGFGRAEPVEARTESRKLEVKALPREGRPASFAGAIGQFTLDAKAAPKTAATGEPVTLTLAVEGRGNFEAVGAPALTGEDGWRVYGPKESFAAVDAIGFGGTKTFEIAMVARRDQAATPGAEFSYFDPQKKKYFTLTADPVAVTAAGGGGAADDTATAAPADGAADRLPGGPTGPLDIAEPARAPAGSGAGFVPWLLDARFHWLNALLLAAVILSIPFLLWQRRRARKSARTAENEALVRQARAAWQQTSDPAEFFTAAAQFVQARLALLDDRPVALIDTDEALGRRVKDPVERQELQSLLARRDELKYGGSGGVPLDPAERRRLAGVLDKFASNHG